MFVPVCVCVWSHQCAFLICLMCLFQNLNIALSRYYDGGRLYISNTLKIFAVNQTHGGTFTCTGYSETGVIMANAQLKVLGK